jgi:hypothetical protein
MNPRRRKYLKLKARAEKALAEVTDKEAPIPLIKKKKTVRSAKKSKKTSTKKSAKGQFAF